MKMFEYMAAGRAIVSADLPVIREVLNETNAVFCESDKVEDWEATIGKFLDDETHGIKLGNQAQRDVQGYTWIARAKRIMNHFP
jgi:glycosyltransferase involved in cell wall biosynthesis